MRTLLRISKLISIALLTYVFFNLQITSTGAAEPKISDVQIVTPDGIKFTRAGSDITTLLTGEVRLYLVQEINKAWPNMLSKDGHGAKGPIVRVTITDVEDPSIQRGMTMGVIGEVKLRGCHITQ